MEKIEKIKEHQMVGTILTSWYFYKESIIGLNIKGDFGEEKAAISDYKHYDLYFRRIQGEINGSIEIDMSGKVLQSLQISKENEFYRVQLGLSDNINIQFECEDIGHHLLRYRGVSYKNVYGTKEFQELFTNAQYVVAEEYFVRQDHYTLPDGYSLEVNRYTDCEKMVLKANMDKCILRHDQEVVYEYECIYHHVKPFTDFIEHSNGHRYYPFHIDLYGISLLELDTGRVYHYVPQGYDNSWGSFYGESFIITDVHYDINTNLIAYGGCYWAAPSDVMVGDFTNPLNFNPRLFNVHELLDPEYEEIDDVDFVCWAKDKLVVKADFEKEFEITVDELKDLIM